MKYILFPLLLFFILHTPFSIEKEPGQVANDKHAIGNEQIVMPPPTVTINPSATERCENATDVITLTPTVDPAVPTGNYSYEWFEQGSTTPFATTETIEVSPTTSTTYVLRVVDDGLVAPDDEGFDNVTIDVLGAPLFNAVDTQVLACSSFMHQNQRLLLLILLPTPLSYMPTKKVPSVVPVVRRKSCLT